MDDDQFRIEVEWMYIEDAINLLYPVGEQVIIDVLEDEFQISTRKGESFVDVASPFCLPVVLKAPDNAMRVAISYRNFEKFYEIFNRYYGRFDVLRWEGNGHSSTLMLPNGDTFIIPHEDPLISFDEYMSHNAYRAIVPSFRCRQIVDMLNSVSSEYVTALIADDELVLTAVNSCNVRVVSKISVRPVGKRSGTMDLKVPRDALCRAFESVLGAAFLDILENGKMCIEFKTSLDACVSWYIHSMRAEKGADSSEHPDEDE